MPWVGSAMVPLSPAAAEAVRSQDSMGSGKGARNPPTSSLRWYVGTEQRSESTEVTFSSSRVFSSCWLPRSFLCLQNWSRLRLGLGTQHRGAVLGVHPALWLRTGLFSF